MAAPDPPSPPRRPAPSPPRAPASTSPASASPADEATSARQRTAELIRMLVASSSFVTMYAGGWAAVALGILVGPYLAALLQMLDGNLQPAPVTVRWPVVATALAAALPIPLAARRRFTLAGAAVLPMLAIVAWQLRVMYQQAGVGAVRF